MAPNITGFPSLLIIVLLTIFQSAYTDLNIKQIALSTRGIECQTPCDKGKGTKYYWCNLVTKGWDYCSPSPSVDYKGRYCQDKCGLHGESYEWCRTEDWGWGYCSRGGDHVITKHYGSFKDKQCKSTCSHHGKLYYWCRLEDFSWDYCSPEEGSNSDGKQCKTECGKHQGTKYQWCYDDNGKWQYCSRVETTSISNNGLESDPNNTGIEFLAAAGGVKVTYSTEGCGCKGLELRSSGPGPRTLKVVCTKSPTTITCEYKGNPHDCKKYNKDQVTFYQQALNDVGSRICSLNPNNMICPRGQIITKLCGDMGKKDNLKYEAGP